MPFAAAAKNREPLTAPNNKSVLAQLVSPLVTVGSVHLCYLHTDSPKLLCSAINPIERLVEHVFVPVAVPCLHIGFDLLEQIGARPLLGGEALRTERTHLAVEAFHVDRARLMILHHDLSPDDDCGDVRAHRALHKGVSNL